MASPSLPLSNRNLLIASPPILSPTHSQHMRTDSNLTYSVTVHMRPKFKLAKKFIHHNPNGVFVSNDLSGAIFTHSLNFSCPSLLNLYVFLGALHSQIHPRELTISTHKRISHFPSHVQQSNCGDESDMQR